MTKPYKTLRDQGKLIMAQHVDANQYYTNIGSNNMSGAESVSSQKNISNAPLPPQPNFLSNQKKKVPKPQRPVDIYGGIPKNRNQQLQPISEQIRKSKNSNLSQQPASNSSAALIKNHKQSKSNITDTNPVNDPK